MPLIVFDLDGTLIDSQRDLADSANELLESLGASPLSLDAVAGMVGDGARVLVERVLAAGGLDPAARPTALDEFLTIYDRRLTIHTRFYPTLLEMLPPLSLRASLAIVTNKPGRHTRAILEQFGVTRAFRWVISGDSGFPRKPDPAGLIHVIAEWAAGRGVQGDGRRHPAHDRVLFVGDSMVDLQTGRNAGVTICFAAYGFGHRRGDLELGGAELVARRSEELPAVIDAFLGASDQRDS